MRAGWRTRRGPGGAARARLRALPGPAQPPPVAPPAAPPFRPLTGCPASLSPVPPTHRPLGGVPASGGLAPAAAPGELVRRSLPRGGGGGGWRLLFGSWSAAAGSELRPKSFCLDSEL